MEETKNQIHQQYFRYFYSNEENIPLEIYSSHDREVKVDILESNYVNQFYGCNAIGGGLALADRIIRSYSKDWFNTPAQVLSMCQIFLSFLISYYAYKETHAIQKAAQTDKDQSLVTQQLLKKIDKKHNAAVVSIGGDCTSLISQISSILIHVKKGAITPLSPESTAAAKFTVGTTTVGTILSFPILIELAKNSFQYLRTCIALKRYLSQKTNITDKHCIDFLKFMQKNLFLKAYIFRFLAIIASFVSRITFIIWLSLQLLSIIPNSLTPKLAQNMNGFMINVALIATILEVGYGFFLLAVYLKDKCCSKKSHLEQLEEVSLRYQLKSVLFAIRSEESSNSMTEILLCLGVNKDRIQLYKSNNDCSDFSLFELARELNLIHLI